MEKLWALGSKGEEINALATDVAKVLKKHKVTIDFLIKTLSEDKK